MDAKQIKAIVQEKLDRFNKEIDAIEKAYGVEVNFEHTYGFIFGDGIKVQSIYLK